MSKKYLDFEGLSHYDSKIKKYIGKTIINLEENGSTTDGTWLAKTDQVSSLVDGTVFIYKVAVAGGSSTTTLKINSLAAKTIYRYGTTKLTNHYGVGQYILLVYNSTNDCFRLVNDYDANSYAYVRQYQHGQNAAGSGNNYPILTRYNLTNKNGSYDTAYSRYYTDTYIDISTGYLYSPKLYSNGNEVATISSLDNYVPNTRTVNGKALSSDIVLNASDVGALDCTTAYIKSASVSGNTLTLTTTGLPVTFTPTFTDTNYYPTRSYTSGLKISSYSGSQNCELYVPYASTSQSGVVTTNNQTFSGNKTITDGSAEASIGIGLDTYDDEATIFLKTSSTKSLLITPRYMVFRNGSSTTFDVNFPTAGGTLALKSDISTNFLSYTATSVTDSSTVINYILGKQTASASGTNYYNSKVYFKGSKLYSNGSEVALKSSLPTPQAIGSATSSSNRFTFNLGTSSTSPNLTTNGGLGVFTFGNCMTIINLYGLSSGVTYKTVGTFIYDSSGSVVTTTLNYMYTKTSSVNRLEIWSGNSDRKIQNNYTGYLYLVKLVY